MAFEDDIIQSLQMRPKCYITISAAHFTITKADLMDSAALLAKLNANPFSEIGAIQKLTIESTRDTVYRRELRYSTAGKPIETIPGLPSYKLNCERVVLYNSMLPKAFGYADDTDILKQNTPLTLKLVLPGPEVSAGATAAQIAAKTAGTKVWYVYGVWFDSNPLEFDVEAVDDLRIIQTTTAIAAGIVGDVAIVPA